MNNIKEILYVKYFIKQMLGNPASCSLVLMFYHTVLLAPCSPVFGGWDCEAGGREAQIMFLSTNLLKYKFIKLG